MKPCICDQCKLLYISSRNTEACATGRVGELESTVSRAHTLKNMEYCQPYPLNHSAQPSVTGVRLSRCAMWLVAVLAEMPQSRALAAATATAKDTLRSQCCKIIYLNIRQWQLFVPPPSCSTCKQAPPSMSSCACLIHALIHTIKIHFSSFPNLWPSSAPVIEWHLRVKSVQVEDKRMNLLGSVCLRPNPVPHGQEVGETFTLSPIDLPSWMVSFIRRVI